MTDPRLLILGVGNTLMGDDGVGVHALHALAEGYELPAPVRLLDGGVAGLGLLGEIAAADYVIIIDALKCGAVPGTIHRLHREELKPRRGPLVSAHEVGIAELLATAEFTGQLPEMSILGVEPLETETVCLELSPPLRRAMPQIIAAIVDILRNHGIEPATRVMSVINPSESERVDARAIDCP